MDGIPLADAVNRGLISETEREHLERQWADELHAVAERVRNMPPSPAKDRLLRGTD